MSPLAQLDVGEVDLHGVGGAERLQDDVVVLEGLGFFFGELAGLDELVDERLIARDLHQPVAAQDVARGCRRPGRRRGVVDQRGGGRGRAHAAARAVGLGLVEDAQARGLDRAHEARARDRRGWRAARRRRQPLVDDVDGELARDLAGGGAAHAVAHAEQGAALADLLLAVGLDQAATLSGQVGDEEVVLVVLADLADVGATEDAHADLTSGLRRHDRAPLVSTSSRNRCWPMRRKSPWTSSRSPRMAR